MTSSKRSNDLTLSTVAVPINWNQQSSFPVVLPCHCSGLCGRESLSFDSPERTPDQLGSAAA